jgi:hypothetical protein
MPTTTALSDNSSNQATAPRSASTWCPSAVVTRDFSGKKATVAARRHADPPSRGPLAMYAGTSMQAPSDAVTEMVAERCVLEIR